MMTSSSMGRPGGREVAGEVFEALLRDRPQVTRGDPERLEMTRRNRDDPEMVDVELRPMLASMATAWRDHAAL